MVGRNLPNLRPNGEDHRGAGRGDPMGMLRAPVSGALAVVKTTESMKSGRKTKIRIRKVLA